MSTPYIGFSNSTLNEQLLVNKGQIVTMPCGHDHILVACDDGNEALLFYNCEDRVFLAAVNHRLISYAKVDAHGEE